MDANVLVALVDSKDKWHSKANDFDRIKWCRRIKDEKDV